MSHFEVPTENHATLNPRLWDGDRMKVKVRVALLRIAREYRDFLDINTPILDIQVTGSQANYNYSEHSDLDLHLIVDYSRVKCDLTVDELFKTKRDLWRQEHQIHIYGIPIELYAEDVNKPAVTSSYSLLHDEWVKRPQHSNQPQDPHRAEQVSLQWIKVITAALKTQDLAQMERVRKLLWAYRRAGLARYGEQGVPNLAFKALRNAGVQDRLQQAIATLKDRDLSLENIK